MNLIKIKRENIMMKMMKDTFSRLVFNILKVT